MKQSELMWGIFEATGNVDAYLIYLDCVKNERNSKNIENRGNAGNIKV